MILEKFHWLRENGFAVFEKGSAIIVIREEYVNSISQDIETDFERLDKDIQTKTFEGRVAHISYQVRGSDIRLVIRKMKRGGLLGPLLGDIYFGIWRPFYELYVSLAARRVGLNTSEIVAIKATRAFPGIYKFTVISKEITNAVDLFAYLKDKEESISHQIIKKVALEINKMHNAGIFHADLNLKNILIKQGGEGHYVYIIDFDKAKIYNNLTPSQRLRNISRLNRSLDKLLSEKVGSKDRLRFLYTYLSDKLLLKKWVRECTKNIWLHKLYWNIEKRIS